MIGISRAVQSLQRLLVVPEFAAYVACAQDANPYNKAPPDQTPAPIALYLDLRLAERPIAPGGNYDDRIRWLMVGGFAHVASALASLQIRRREALGADPTGTAVSH